MREKGRGGNGGEFGRTKGIERSQTCQPWAQFALPSPILHSKVPRATWPQQVPALSCVEEEGA